MKKLLLTCFALVFALSVWAQERTVTGKVTAADDGTALPGVSIILKGTTVGTSTDVDGVFSISIPSSEAVLVFTFVGLKSQEIVVGEKTRVDVVLESDATQLSEVIVSGVAGATSRQKLTVSVTKVGEDKLNAVTGMSLATSLTGKVAGVRISNTSGTPGAAADIILRADNNLTEVSSSPLIMIDGMIMQGSLADINADDVESMEVIKGAAASALYGSRAGNGVISITTKRGSRLDVNSVKINVRNEIGVQEIAKNLDLATHHVYQLAPDAASFRGQYTKYNGVTYPAGYTGGGFHPGITGNRLVDADHYMDNEYGVTRDLQDEFFKTGSSMVNFVSVASRSEKSSVYASFENNKQSGIIMNTDGYKRQNFRLNYDLQLAPWFKLTTSNLFINTATNYPGSGGGIFFNIVLAEPDADLHQPNPDGQPYYLRMNQFNGETVNPLYPLWKAERDNKTRRWMGSYSANIELASWANIDLTQTIEIENYRYRLYNPKDTWTPTGGTPATFGMSYTNGSLEQYSRETKTQNSQVTLNLSHKFNDLLVRGKLSYLFENRSNEWFDVSATQFQMKQTPVFDNFNQITDAYSGQEYERAQNYFAILGFDWRDKILLDGMYRYDGSSLFGADARWNSYYRVSGAYRLSQDLKIPGIDELKIRAAYGTAGIRPGFSFQYEIFTLTNGSAQPDQAGNSQLKPSTTTETELGLNVSFLKNFTFEAVYAKSITDDQFLNVPKFAPLNGGFPSRYENAGTVESNTIEMTLGANWLNNKNLKWTTNVVFSRIRAEITDLPIPAYNYGSTDGGAQTVFRVEEGQPYGSMYGNVWVRSLEEMSQQLPVGKTIADYEVNSDGYVVPAGSIGTPTEMAIKKRDANGNPVFTKIGDGNADFNMGIANTLSYKGITLYVLVDIKKGGDIYNSKAQWITRDLRHPSMDMSGVAPEQRKAYDYFVNFYDTNIPNAYWVEDASFVKLREVAIGYSIPSSVLNGFLKGAIKGANLKVVGRNLLTFSDYSGYDPEVGSLREPYDGTYKYPNFRNYAVSLSLDF